jgi:hypothetical protein
MKEKTFLIATVVFLALVLSNLVVLDLNLIKQKKENLSLNSLPIEQAEVLPTPSISLSSEATSNSSQCDLNCQQMIDQKISQAIATLSANKTTSQQTKTTVQKISLPQVIYIPLGGSGSSSSRDWADVGNAEVYFDLNDYPSLVEARFEGFISVKNGNGKTFARLYDATHSIGVQGSEIEVTSESFTMAISGPLSLWQGKNLYRVQIKSLNGYDANFDSGRIKLILK